ncbi:hypothetical protein [Marinagarivorans algicola]|uniref:hypothetical protein n=1 Tax=Marinagarivorans algicola TaxID=1513270 RepID=UPI0006B987BA|nr:hypothetical protein [Marinagarivorans algicola]
MFRKIIGIALLCLIAQNSCANNSFNSGKVVQVILHDWGRVLVFLEGGITTGELCTNKSYIALKKDNQFFSEMYSALLSAYHSGSSVGGWVNGCDESHNAPILTRLDLIPKSI